MKKIIILAVILLAMTGLVGWKKMQSANQGVHVNSDLVSKQVVSESILASGHLVFDKQVQIRSEVMGVVSEVLVVEGQHINKGDTLLTLDPTAFSADVANNQASVNAQLIQIELLEEQSSELFRQLKLSQKLQSRSILSEDKIQRLQSEAKLSLIKIKAAKEHLNQNVANLDLAKTRLQKATFIAPISGIISTIDVKRGETVIAGTTNILGSSLMTLADPLSILAELRVDEADIANVQAGQTVAIFTSARPKSALHGVVTKIGTSARSDGSNQGLYYHVKTRLEQQEKLYPGMSCRAEIITANTQPSLTVPISAIQEHDDENFVWIIENNQAKKRLVTVGMANDTQQVIDTGLELNERIITGPGRAIRNLQEGMPLNAEES